MPAMSTLTSLNDEWLHTGRREFASGPWAGRSAGDVLGLVRAEPDRVLLGLLALARDGDRLAGRTVVQALLGKLVTMAVADRRLAFDDLLAALWVRLATYPIERRPAKVAANLVLDARKDVLAEQRGLRAITSHVPSPSGPGAAAVLDAALGLGLIDATSRAILGSVYADGLTSAQAAGRHGTTATAVRWRCSRDVRRLAARSLDLWLVAA